MTTIKTCSKCGENKPLSKFSKQRTRTDGLHAHCKACRIEYARQYRITHKEKIAAHHKQYYAANHEAMLAKASKDRHDHLDIIRLCDRRSYRKHAQEQREKSRRYARTHREARSAYSRTYQLAHPEQAQRYRERHPERTRAGCLLRSALIHGRIHKPDRCSMCNTPTEAQDLHGHHDSYAPEDVLQVRFLCRTCHADWHIKAKEAGEWLPGYIENVPFGTESELKHGHIFE